MNDVALLGAALMCQVMVKPLRILFVNVNTLSYRCTHHLT
jgi:hypothetical protein